MSTSEQEWSGIIPMTTLGLQKRRSHFLFYKRTKKSVLIKQKAKTFDGWFHYSLPQPKEGECTFDILSIKKRAHSEPLVLVSGSANNRRCPPIPSGIPVSAAIWEVVHVTSRPAGLHAPGTKQQ